LKLVRGGTLFASLVISVPMEELEPGGDLRSAGSLLLEGLKGNVLVDRAKVPTFLHLRYRNVWRVIKRRKTHRLIL